MVLTGANADGAAGSPASKARRRRDRAGPRDAERREMPRRRARPSPTRPSCRSSEIPGALVALCGQRVEGRRLMATILLVDDRPQNLLALEAILEPLGQRLVRATSGDEALRRLLDGTSR